MTFSIPHEELMKQTVHKKLEDVSIETDEGTIKLTDFSMNKLQSTMTAEISGRTCGKTCGKTVQ